MRISCVVNFREKPIKNLPYYKLLLRQMTGNTPYESSSDIWVGESAALSAGGEGVISKICEGYQFVIAFSGEILKKEQLIKELSALGYRFTAGSCAELALNAYIHFGDKSPERLEGTFSYVIYDTMRRQVFAASDSEATFPLFYSKCEDAVVISSHIKGILAYPAKMARISKKSLCSMLTDGTPANIFEGMGVLPPASVLKIKESGTTVAEYKPKSVQPLSCRTKDNAAAIILSPRDEELCERIIKEGAADSGIHTYSHAAATGVCKKYDTSHTQVIFGEQALVWGLSESVSACGVPVLSQTDFLLAPIFSKVPKFGFQIFLPKEEKRLDMRRIFLENKVFHPAVEESLAGENTEACCIINAPRQIAERLGVSVKTVAVSGNAASGGDYERCDREILKGLRRILLCIIAEDTAPILAFFDKSALLGVCERGIDFSGSTREEASLIAYIIKLNIWLLKYRPRLI